MICVARKCKFRLTSVKCILMHALLLHDEKVKVYNDMLKFVSLNQIIEKVKHYIPLVYFYIMYIVLVSYSCHNALVMCWKSGF